MRIGIFAKTFVRSTLEETLDAVVAHGLDCTQFNFACAGLPSMPDTIGNDLAERIANAMRQRRLHLAAVSGTFNMIHPDRRQRENGFRRFEVIASHCKTIGANLVTLCTGTFDSDDMWRAHPENDSPQAWKDLLGSMEHALRIAGNFGLTLGVEPELANVINSASKARRLLDELKDPRLKIIMDGANLLHASDLPLAPRIWQEAFDLLGTEIRLAHAKDMAADGIFVAAGRGALDFDLYARLLRSVNFAGPIILHGLAENEVSASVRLLKDKLAAVKSASAAKGRP